MMGLELDVTLSLREANGYEVSGTVMDGILTGTTKNAVVKFVDLKIFSSGYFFIEASALNSTIGISHKLAITNFIKSVELVEPKRKFYIYDHAYYTIKSYGDDDQLYRRVVSYIDNSIKLHLNTDSDLDSHLINYEIIPYCLGPADLSVEIIDFSNFFVKKSFMIGPNPYAEIRVNYEESYKNYPYPALSTDIFGGKTYLENLEFFIRVRDYDFPLYRGHCSEISVKPICISKMCSGEKTTFQNLGNRFVYDTEGNYYRNDDRKYFNINIKSTGDFEVLFSIQGANSGQLNYNGTIMQLNMTNFIKNIYVQKVYSKAYIDENFPISFMIVGDDDLLYIKKHNLTISSNCLSKVKILENIEGYVQTELVFNQTGSCSAFVWSTHSQLLNISFSVLVDLYTSERVQYFNLSNLVINI